MNWYNFLPFDLSSTWKKTFQIIWGTSSPYTIILASILKINFILLKKKIVPSITPSFLNICCTSIGIFLSCFSVVSEFKDERTLLKRPKGFESSVKFNLKSVLTIPRISYFNVFLISVGSILEFLTLYLSVRSTSER